MLGGIIAVFIVCLIGGWGFEKRGCFTSFLRGMAILFLIGIVITIFRL